MTTAAKYPFPEFHAEPMTDAYHVTIPYDMDLLAQLRVLDEVRDQLIETASKYLANDVVEEAAGGDLSDTFTCHRCDRPGTSINDVRYCHTCKREAF